MACVYCRSPGQESFAPRAGRLTQAEWAKLLEALRELGVVRVRLTGGEPLLSPEVTAVVRCAADLGFEDIALTTNASRLSPMAGALKTAGLMRVNVSLDSLSSARFRELTRGGQLSAVLAGISAARSQGLELRTNTVVLRGQNDGELEQLASFAWEHSATPRFLEVMAVGQGGCDVQGALVSVAEMRTRLNALLSDGLAQPEIDRGPARYVTSRCGTYRAGFISGMTQSFCEGCDRLRVTSTGEVRACLSMPVGLQLADLVRSGAPRTVLVAKFLEAWGGKPAGDWVGCGSPSARAVTMRAVGG
jgi:cyclic pyranopterin phosphate synthase